jgi:hypothetical protein
VHARRVAWGSRRPPAPVTERCGCRDSNAIDRRDDIACAHVDDATTTRCNRLGYRSNELIGHVNSAALIWLVCFSGNFFGDYLWAAYLHLIALAAHVFDQHCQLQFATTCDFDDVG